MSIRELVLDGHTATADDSRMPERFAHVNSRRAG